jgi:hypothetical protein
MGPRAGCRAPDPSASFGLLSGLPGPFDKKSLLNSFHPETVLFRPGCVNLKDCLCGVPWYASAQSFDFLARTKNSSFPNWKPIFSYSASGWMLNTKSIRKENDTVKGINRKKAKE